MKMRLSTWVIAPLLLVMGTSSAGAREKGGRTMTFSKDNLDKVPTGWKADHTGQNGGGTWKVVADDTAPSKKGHVLSQTGESPGPVFNLCVADGTSYKNVE